ncbi:DUF4373 domain-containing protein [Flavobacterium psychrophilum]|nr:DUF4373 domain-containing protein [Flavobacterium psychrophilum]EKT4550381.1 DUF4373 domain-containing protein [Flavobacterium psychrophilum]
MARPKRENAEYFSHDANMRNDPKIKALRKKFKEGYSVYNMFLEYLTDCRFFEVEMTDLEYEIMSGDFDVETEILIDILNYCVKIGLLNKTENVFFSNGLKKRLQPVLDKRNKAKTSFLSQFATETEKKEEKVQKSLVSVTETTQSKVKESKVKESKVKESKVKEIKKEEEITNVISVDLKNQLPVPKIDFNKLLSFFNENRGLLPEVKKFSEARKKRVLILEKQYGKESIQVVIEKTRDSPFLQGENKENWTASFDWIFKPANFLKILEDNYARKQNTRGSNSTTTDAEHKQSAVSAVNAMFGVQ